MRFRAHGVDRSTGTEVSKTIEADSQEEAEAIAQRSLIVETVEPSTNYQAEPDVPVIPYRGPATNQEARRPAPVATPTPSRRGGARPILIGCIVVLAIWVATIWNKVVTLQSTCDRQETEIADLRAELHSLTITVNYNAEVANRNNLLR